MTSPTHHSDLPISALNVRMAAPDGTPPPDASGGGVPSGAAMRTFSAEMGRSE